MENVLLPVCSCGLPVMYEIEQIPIYEDGIHVAMQQGSVWFHTKCEECAHSSYVADGPHDDQDELPF